MKRSIFSLLPLLAALSLTAPACDDKDDDHGSDSATDGGDSDGDDTTGGGSGGSGGSGGTSDGSGGTSDGSGGTSGGSGGSGGDGGKPGDPCMYAEDCAGKVCLFETDSMDDWGFCSQPCVDWTDCPDFWDCVDIGNASGKACVPD